MKIREMLTGNALKASIPLLLMFGLLVALYLPALNHDLVYDSKNLFSNHPLLAGDAPLAAAFSSGFLERVGMDMGKGAYYRPLTILSFMVEKRLWGIHAATLRLVNLLIFFVALAGLYLLLKRWSPSTVFLPAAALVLFALHPMHADNIVWVVGRSDLLMFLWGIFAFLFLDFYHSDRNRWFLAAAAACFAAGLMSKEAALFLLPCFAVYERVRHGKISIPFYAASGVTAVAFFIAKSAVVGMVAVHFRAAEGWLASGAALVGTLGYYVRSLLVPHLSTTFLPPREALEPINLAVGLAAAAVLSLLAWSTRRRTFLIPPLVLFFVFTAGHLSLVFTSLFPFRASARYLVFPLLAVIWLVLVWASPRRRTQTAVVMALFAVSFLPVASAWAGKYTDERTFWQRLQRDHPGEGYISTRAAETMIRSGEYSDAEAVLRRTLTGRMDPPTAVNAAILMAEIEFFRARYPRAEQWLERLDKLPQYPEAVLRRGRIRARIHISTGDTAGAERELSALMAKFDVREPHVLLVKMYRGRLWWRRALEAEARMPGGPVTTEGTEAVRRRFEAMSPAERFRFFVDHKNYGEAVRLLRTFPPDRRRALLLAKLLYWHGREAEGNLAVSEVVSASQGDHLVLNRIANFYLTEMFRWDEAASYFKKSLQVEPDQPAVRSLVAFLQETHGL